MARGQLIVYRANHLPRTEESRLSRELYGYTDKSQYGRYTYRRPGLLDQVPHIIPLGWKALLVTRQKDAQAVIKILEEHKAQVYARKIELEEEDLRTLCPEYEKTKTQEDQ
jgi:hypothetical protein